MLAKRELNSIETLVSEALIDMSISHEEFITILKEKWKYVKMKENLRNLSKKTRKYETNVNSRTYKITSPWMIYKSGAFNQL